MQQIFTCHMESTRKRKMRVELESIHLQHLLSHNSLAECFTKKKNRQHFHDHAANYYNREYKSRCPLKQNVWLTLHIHINPRSLNTCIRNVWRSANHDFSLFRHDCDICQQKSWICEHFCEKWFSCRQSKPFCRI